MSTPSSDHGHRRVAAGFVTALFFLALILVYAYESALWAWDVQPVGVMAVLAAISAILAATGAWGGWRFVLAGGKPQGKVIRLDLLLVVVSCLLLSFAALRFFATARQGGDPCPERCRKSCVNHLREIAGAKEQWADAGNRKPGDTPTMSDLVGIDHYIKTTPRCRGGGVYTVNPVGVDPVCSASSRGHILPH